MRLRAGFKKNAELIRMRVKCNIQEAQERQKRYFDRFVSYSVQFNVNDLVLLVNERNKLGQSKSFRVRASGPFIVRERFNDVNFRIESVASGNSQVVHYNRLRPYTKRSDRIEIMRSPVPSANTPKEVQVIEELNPLVTMHILNLLMNAGTHSNVISLDEVGIAEDVAVVEAENDIANNGSDAVQSIQVGDYGSDAEATGINADTIQMVLCHTCERSFKGVRGLNVHLRRVNNYVDQ